MLLDLLLLAPEITLPLQDFLTLGGAILIGGSLWRQISTNTKAIRDLKEDVERNMEQAELRAQRAEDHQVLMIDRISEKLEDMGERFLQFGQELKEILANHNTRLTLLERQEMGTTDEQIESD